jgi:quercetin dioxygenase-like cupin family protein
MQGRNYLRTHTLKSEQLLIDLGEAAVELHGEASGQDRRSVTLIRESGLSVVLLHLHAGAILDEHAAPGAVTVQVIDGHARARAGNESIDLPAGRLVAFDANVRHTVEAVDDSTILITLADPKAP